MPDGAAIPIQAVATDLELRPLRGKVEGNNTGKNVLVRSLSGIGAAGAVLLGRGSLDQPLSESDLLRERVSNNIGEAADEQRSRLAVTRHIQKADSSGRLSADQQHGSERRSMGDFAARVCGTTSNRWARASVAGCAGSFEWRTLDSAYLSAMAGSSGSLSTLSNLPSSLSAVATGRSFRSDLADAGQGSGATRRNRFERRLHRCHLQRGQKGGSGVGKTKRGKGTKIMAITDRHGLPVAVHVASASPHETRLVEATLQQTFTPHPPKKLMGSRL